MSCLVDFKNKQYGQGDEQVEYTTSRKHETDQIYSTMSDNIVQC